MANIACPKSTNQNICSVSMYVFFIICFPIRISRATCKIASGVDKCNMQDSQLGRQVLNNIWVIFLKCYFINVDLTYIIRRSSTMHELCEFYVAGYQISLFDIYRLIHGNFHIDLVIIPRPPYWSETQCIKLFITYFRHLEKRNSYWPRYGNDLVVIQ